MDWIVVTCAIDIVESATTDSATDDAISILMIQVAANNVIKCIRSFWNPSLTAEKNDENDRKLENSLTNDVLKHLLRNNVFISAVWMSIQEFLCWWFSCQCQAGQGIHNKVDPEHLDRLENWLFE